MIQPSATVVRALAHISQNVPAVRDWIVECADTELNRLPQTVNNMAVAQGRCQVLEELRKLLIDAPDLAAQSKG